MNKYAQIYIEEFNKQAYGLGELATVSGAIASLGGLEAGYRHFSDDYIKENRKNVPNTKVLGIDTGITSANNEQTLQDNKSVDTRGNVIRAAGYGLALPAMGLTTIGVEKLDDKLKELGKNKLHKETLKSLLALEGKPNHKIPPGMHLPKFRHEMTKAMSRIHKALNLKGKALPIGIGAGAATTLAGVGLSKLYSYLNTKEYE